MFRSIRARIIAATAGCLVVALLLNTVINFQVTRQDNQQSQRDILTSTSASHNMAIADWVKSKMTVIASAQTVALSDDPVPVFKQLAQAGGFTNVYVGYASKPRNSLSPRAYLRIMTRPFARGISRWSARTARSSPRLTLMQVPVNWW